MGAGPMIPVEEDAERRERAALLVAEAGFDILVGNAHESDASVVRYFSAYWPLFEMGGVAIAPSGQSALMVGMESGEYAKLRSHIPNIGQKKPENSKKQCQNRRISAKLGRHRTGDAREGPKNAATPPKWTKKGPKSAKNTRKIDCY